MLLYTHTHTHTRVYAHKHAHTSSCTLRQIMIEQDSGTKGLGISTWAGREVASDGSSALTWLLLFSFRPLNSISASAEPSL